MTIERKGWSTVLSVETRACRAVMAARMDIVELSRARKKWGSTGSMRGHSAGSISGVSSAVGGGWSTGSMRGHPAGSISGISWWRVGNGIDAWAFGGIDNWGIFGCGWRVVDGIDAWAFGGIDIRISSVGGGGWATGSMRGRRGKGCRSGATESGAV